MPGGGESASAQCSVIGAPVVPAPLGLVRMLERTPPLPTSLASFILGHQGELRFRSLVHELFPTETRSILDARDPQADRETARVWAFCRKFEADFFPIYEAEEYDQLVCCVPFLRFGWSYDSFHDLERPPGCLLLMAICALPVDDGPAARVPLLDAVERLGVEPELLAEVPEGGLASADLHERLDGTPFEPAADLADWMWGQTGAVFLDLDDEIESAEVEWSPENVHELQREWVHAQAIMGGIDQLGIWLAADPGPRFGVLLDAAVGHSPHLCYRTERRLYACEITETGIISISEDEPDLCALSRGLAA